jgi:hypothetical protein
MQGAQGRALITLGNQKCIGATPAFNRRAKIIIKNEFLKEEEAKVPIRRRPDPVACAKKYFILASFCCEMKN